MNLSRQQVRAQARAQAFEEVAVKARRRIALRLARRRWREARLQSAAAALVVFATLLGLVPGEVRAQGTRKDDIVINARGFPAAGANVAVCTQPAVTTATPCSPLASIFSNPQLTQALVNPLATDGLGNYNFYAAPGKYTIQIYGTGITTKVLTDVILPNDPSAPTFTSVTTTSGITAFSLTLSGNLTVSGSASVTLGMSAATMTLTNQASAPATPPTGTLIFYSKTDKNLYKKDDTGTEIALAVGNGAGTLVFASIQAGATADLKIQAAMNALPATGGTVMVDLQGSQTVSSDVFNAITKNVHLVWTSGQYTFSPATTTFPRNIVNEFRNGAQWLVGTGLTVNAKGPLMAGNYQISVLTGTGVVNCLPDSRTSWFNVMWWGAKGDLTVDDEPAILAASTAARLAGGGIVDFPAAVPTGFPAPGSAGYAIVTAFTIPPQNSAQGKGLLVWQLHQGLRLQATVTLASHFAIIGMPGPAPVLNIAQFQAAPTIQVYCYFVSPCFNAPFTGGVGLVDLYMANLTISQPSGSTGSNIVLDYVVGSRFVNVYNALAADNITGFPYDVKGGFNNQWVGGGAYGATITSTATISTISRSGSTVTVTTTAAHNMKVGDFVSLSGVTDSANFPATNATVISVPSSTQITYQQAGSAVSSSGGSILYLPGKSAILFERSASNGNAMPGIVEISGNFALTGHGIRIDTTAGGTTGGQHIYRNILQDGGGIGPGESFLTVTGGNSQLVNEITLEQISVSDFGNGGIPGIAVVGFPANFYLNGWHIVNFTVESTLSPLFFDPAKIVQGVWTNNLGSSQTPSNGTGGAGTGLSDGWFGQNIGFRYPSGVSTPTTRAEGSVYLSVVNGRPIYIQMQQPGSQAATLAAGGSLTVGQAYSWWVTAVDDKGEESGQPDPTTARLGSPLTYVTLTPTTGNQTANLTWTAAAGAASYNVYRSASNNFSAAPVRFTGITGTSFSDTGGAGTSGFNPPSFNVAAVARLDSAGVTAQQFAIRSGVSNDLGGFKHKRFGATCATAATAGATCTTTFSWTTAFADANYTVSCSGVAPTGTPSLAINANPVAASVTVVVTAITAAASSFAGVHCVAVHD